MTKPIWLKSREKEEAMTEPIWLESWKLGRHDNPNLPFDIIVNIISRLSVKVIIGCKSLSKDFNKVISHPSFSHIYLANYSAYFHTIFLNNKEHAFSLDLAEFEKEDLLSKRKYDNKISELAVDRLPGETISERKYTVWGNCNGLVCFLEVESDLCNLFLTNPMFGQVIRLPIPYLHQRNKLVFYAYGLGHCQFTNRYKVLRIIGNCGRRGAYKVFSEIFTVGVDKNWRLVSDVNVPYNMKNFFVTGANQQTDMVAFRSALHWIVQPIPIGGHYTMEPTWGGKVYISAFDMTEEKVRALPFPTEVAAKLPFFGHLRILLDKLCIWQHQIWDGNDNLWVMEDYGVEGSWTKQYIFNVWTLPKCIKGNSFLPLTVSSEGVCVVTDGHKLISYDFKKKKILKIINQTGIPLPFVPNFVPLSI